VKHSEIKNEKLSQSLKISVIVATMNAGKTLEECLLSIIKQDYRDFEIIIVDGLSTDNTIDIIKKYSYGIKYWESSKDNGVYDAWNKGLAQATGDWICFLGADDILWSENVLSEFEPHLRTAYPQSRFVYGGSVVLSEDGDFVREVRRPWSQARKVWSSEMLIPHPGSMHHRKVFEDFGGFDPNFKISGDYDLLLREFKIYPPYFVPEVVQTGCREGGISANTQTMTLALRERRAALIKNGYKYSRIKYVRVCVLAWAKVRCKQFLRLIFGEKFMRKAQREYQRRFGLVEF